MTGGVVVVHKHFLMFVSVSHLRIKYPWAINGFFQSHVGRLRYRSKTTHVLLQYFHIIRILLIVVFRVGTLDMVPNPNFDVPIL